MSKCANRVVKQWTNCFSCLSLKLFDGDRLLASSNQLRIDLHICIRFRGCDGKCLRPDPTRFGTRVGVLAVYTAGCVIAAVVSCLKTALLSSTVFDSYQSNQVIFERYL